MAMERVQGPLIGPRRADMHAAQIVTILANLNRDPKHKAYELDDFALRFELPYEPGEHG